MRALLLCAALLSACVTPPIRACPGCEVLSPDLRLRPDTEQVFVLVPGVLGYGWEWNGAQVALRQVPRTEVLILPWDPWGSLRAAGRSVGEGLRHLIASGPRRVTVIGHSVGGLVTILAAAGLAVPQGVDLHLVTIGAPFAGTHFSLFDFVDPLSTPTLLAVGGTFTGWPDPPLGARLTVYQTGAGDPVMQRRMGHDPGSPAALPRGAQVRRLPDGVDHNLVVTWVAEELAQSPREEAR